MSGYTPMAPNYLPVVQALARDYPQEFADCHRPELGERAWAFIKRVAWTLHTQMDPRFGLNGKRGDVNDPSMDAVAYLNATSLAGGVEIIDVVAHAGETNPNKPQPAPAWIDQTLATIAAGTIGAWISPDPVDSGTVTPPQPPTPGGECAACAELREQVQVVLAQQQAMLGALTQTATKDDVRAVQDALWGLIAGQVIDVHLDDLKARVDGVQADVTKLLEKRSCRFLS